MIKSETETTITYNMEDSTATVYTCMPAVMRRIESKGVTADREYRSDGQVVAKQYTVPKKWIRISPPRRVGEEQRRAAAIRMHARREMDTPIQCGVGANEQVGGELA